MAAKSLEDTKPGDRISLVCMYDPDPILPGTKGTILWIVPCWGDTQIVVLWDEPRDLCLICPPDEFEFIDEG